MSVLRWSALALFALVCVECLTRCSPIIFGGW
jgi:hypothetical protein